MKTRKATRKIQIRERILGAKAPILLQSMTLARPFEEEKAQEEIRELAKAGSDLVRLAVVTSEDIAPLSRLTLASPVPLIADIHFRPELALEALEVTDAVRINPTNIGDEDALRHIIKKAKELHKPMRFGFNQGSLKQHSSTPAQDLVSAAMETEKIAIEEGYLDYCLSVKSSDVETCISAYTNLSRVSEAPLHIGLTEAGTPERGLVSSSIALGTLLREGVGDTIRISLSTEDRTAEIRAEKDLLSSLDLFDAPRLVSCPNCGRRQCNTLPIAREISRFLSTLPKVKLTVAVMGCAVNGPGEARDADIGIAGGIHEALLFKKGKAMRKIPEKDIIPVLEEAIKEIVNEKLASVK